MPHRFSKPTTLTFSLILAVTLLVVYWTGLSGDFAFDDLGSIVGNTALRSGADGQNTWLAAANSGVAGPLGRGLSMLSFAFNYRFFGEDAVSFKLTNLSIHYVNALLVLILVRQILPLLNTTIETRRAQIVAMLVCAAWTLHPMNALPVLYVVQRMTSLSAFFMLAGLSLYLFGRRTPNRLGYAAIAASLLLCWPAAVLSKETGVLFAVYLLLCEWLLLRSFQKAPPRILWTASLIGGAMLLTLSWANWGMVTSGYRVRDFDLPERLMTETRVLWFYVQQLALPVPGSFGLYLDDIAVSRGLLSPPSTAAAIAGWMVVLSLAYTQRLRWPTFSFAVFWFWGSHLLESTVVPLELVFEHRNYVASLGLFVWLACLAVPPQSGAATPRLRLVLALVFVCYCAFVTSLRASQWSDDFTRRQVEVYNHPQSARAHYEMAISLQERTFEAGQPSPAAYQRIHDHLQSAATLDTNNKLAPLGLLYLDCLADKPQNPANLKELMQRFATQRFSYLDRNAVQGLSVMLINNKLCLPPEDVRRLLEAGLSNPQLDNSLRAALYAVGMDYALARLQDPHLALQYAQTAVAVAPSEVAFRSNLIHLYLRMSQLEEAKSEYSRLSTLPTSAAKSAAMTQLKVLIDSAKPHAPEH